MLLPLSAAIRLKLSSLRFQPPSSMARPRTTRMLPMMEPVSEALTISVSPARRAMKRDDQLRGVAEGRVQQAADVRPRVVGEVLGGLAHEPGQREDGQAGGDEHHGRGGVRQPQVQR